MKIKQILAERNDLWEKMPALPHESEDGTEISFDSEGGVVIDMSQLLRTERCYRVTPKQAEFLFRFLTAYL